jgi:FtsZ-binding cell division protein ZapB
MMQEDQLKLLESRISKAIDFIETLKSREKGLLQEKEKMERKIQSLEKTLKEKEERVRELKGSQEFLKEKIETILGKLESFANIESEGQTYHGRQADEKPESEEAAATDDQVIIEEDMVELETGEEKGGTVLSGTEQSVVQMDDIENPSNDEGDKPNGKKNKKKQTDEDQNPLFNAVHDIDAVIQGYGETTESVLDDQSSGFNWVGDNPFIDI